MADQRLDQSEIDKLRKRALAARNGYTADVNITCYVYGRDVLTLLDEVERLRESIERLKSEGESKQAIANLQGK